MKSTKKNRVSDEAIYATIIQMCTAAGVESVVRPEAVAQELNPDEWQSLLKRVRLFAKELAQEGHILILRKGKPADLDDLKGIIHLQISPDYLPSGE